ncbi:MAG: hypothetical protein DWP98_03535 [Bacteroidetes bacterium]|nr:MAG: hypothetical protein DWP98_03535 [Bacteroidota bacterium]MBL1144115.1 hypothetical protein [Bacteroidota bacterium]NOG56910.1 hypothetical protein [Bacteroidota bacterium]
MKTILKILGGLVLLVILALILIPIIFKDDIVKMVKDETNAALNATVDFGDFDLSLIKSFPNFYFTIENVKVTGIGDFEGLELAAIKELNLTVDLMSVINGETINVKNITILEPNIHAKVLADGKANYDIVKESEESEVETIEETTEASAFKMQLTKVEIIKGGVIYDDATFPMYMSIADLNLNLSGDLTEAVTTIKALGGVGALNLTYDGVKFMNAAKITLDAAMEADIDNFKFTFHENEVKVNELGLGFDGWLAMPNDPIDMDITFLAKKADFKEILSLVPAEFAKDLEGVKTSGSMALNGYAKGTYVDSTYPAFGISLEVLDAMFSYPDLPKSVENIQINASVESKDGNLDHTIVDVPKFHLSIADNPFDLNFYLATPMSDPFIRAGLNGKVVLDNLKDVIPLEKSDKLNGTITSNISIEGHLSTLENEQYEAFKANGTLLVEGMHFESDSLDYPVDLSRARMTFSPKFVELNEMNMQLGKSDLDAQGRLENFIAYALKDKQTLKGVLNVQSNLLDINELAGIDPNAAEEEASAEASSDSSAAPMEVVLLPKYIDFTTTANIKKLRFDNINIEEINGAILLKNEKVSLDKTSMKMLGGKMTLDGFYETTDSLKPSYSFDMNIIEFDVQQTVTTFNSVEKLVPIAMKTEGAYSTGMSIKGALDSKMEPIYETMFGQGKLKTKNIQIRDYKPLKKVADAIKYDKLNPMAINNVDISFKITEGKVFVEPFTNKIGNSTVTIAGSNSFDQTIDYIFSFAIPRSEFGGAANTAIDGLLAQAAGKGVDLKLAETINIDVRLSGPATDPKITTDFKKAKSDATNAIKEKAKEEFNKAKEELEAKAREELEKKKAEAEAEAKRIIEEQKQKAKEELEKQKEEAKKKLEEEAKKKLKGLFGK